MRFSLISSLILERPQILEIGYGNGWLVERLLSFGPVTGVDIADAAIQEALHRVPSAEVYSGNILEMGLPHNSFDVVVTLETFSHVADQPKLIEVIANLLRDRGYLILSTQNCSIYIRNSRIAPPAEAQLRRWVTMQELRQLLSGRFECLRSGPVEPSGNRGLLGVVNSVKVTAFLSRIFSKKRVVRAEERLGQGQTLVMLARKRRCHLTMHLFIRDVQPIAITSAPVRVPNPSLTSREMLSAWAHPDRPRPAALDRNYLRMSLSCPRSYAYGESHLGGKVALRPLSDLRERAG